MRNRAYLLVALLGLLTFALAPGTAAAGQGKNLSEVALASGVAARAAAVSGPVISVTPLAHDFGIVNIGASQSFTFAITNTGTSVLNITGATVSSPTNFSATVSPLSVAVGGTSAMTVTYHPIAGVDVSGTVTINSNATNGAFTVNVSGRGNAAPVLDPIGNKAANAFVNLTFTTTASDNGDQIDDALTFSVSPSLPVGATYNSATGVFSWTPTLAESGTYTLTFSVSDGFASDSETIMITVTSANSPPIAEAGGPYVTGVNQPLTLNGSLSTDPDGDALTYAWNFGDGDTGVGATVVHTYTALGNFTVLLTVTDDGSPALSATDDAQVSVVNIISGTIAVKLAGGKMSVAGGSQKQAIGLEITALPLTAIDPASIRLSTTTAGANTTLSLAPDVSKGVGIGDLDHDGLNDLDVFFLRSDLQRMFGALPNNSIVTLVIDARTNPINGSIPIHATGTVKIKNGGGQAVSSFASPNPFNPETAINFTLRNSGPVSVRIYSLDGRLVKTLKDEFAAAGTHEVRWNGTNDAGHSVPSGMYFVKTESGADTAVFKLSLLK